MNNDFNDGTYRMQFTQDNLANSQDNGQQPVNNENVTANNSGMEMNSTATNEQPPVYNWSQPVYEQPKERAKKVKNKKPITFSKLILTSISCSLIAILITSGIMYYAYTQILPDKYATKTQAAASQIGKTSTATSISNKDTTSTVASIVKEVMPAVVAITSTSIYTSSYNPFSSGSEYQVTGAGSGIIIGKNDTELLIVTNNHVVADTEALTITFCDDTTADAIIKGTNSNSDLAVVAIKLEDISDETLATIKIATLGSSDDLEVGEGVIAIGNALGYGQSVTTGIVSALNREITIDDKTFNMIQTDTAINGGNSGGALINMQGEVIGINAAKKSSSSGTSSASIEGMGYAIPISQAKEIIEELMNKETKDKVDDDERGYLGLSGSTVDSTYSTQYDVPEGVLVQKVTKGSPADKAGIRRSDVIVGLEGESINTWDDLSGILQYYAAGETVTVTVKTLDGNEYIEKSYEVTLCKYDDLQN